MESSTIKLLLGCVLNTSLSHIHPSSQVSSPTLLALCWGVAATLGVGLVLGFLLAQASQSPGLPGMPVSSLYRPLLAVLGVTAAAAIVAGCIGFALADRSILVLTELRPDAWINSFPVLSRIASWPFGFAHGDERDRLAEVYSEAAR